VPRVGSIWSDEQFTFEIDRLTIAAVPEPENVAVVPEPTTFALMLSGLGVIGAAARRRKAA
jgi:hypothetical protein